MKNRSAMGIIVCAAVAAFSGMIPALHGQYWTPVSAGAPIVESSPSNPTTIRALGCPGGKLLVGPNYPIVNGSYSNGAWLRLNSDGTTDTSYNHPSGAHVLLAYPDGKILVSRYVDASAIAVSIQRILANGDNDPNFVSVSVDNGSQLNAELLADGRVFIFGGFSRVDGVSQSTVAMLGTNGAPDPSFQSPFVSSFSSQINSAKATADGQHIIIAGGFLGLATGTYVARLDLNGSVDVGFHSAVSTGSNGENVSRVYPDAQGGVLVAYGQYTKIVRLTATGALDAGFNPALVGSSWSFGPQQVDGKIFYIAFDFLGDSQGKLHRMNSDGSDDSTFPAISGTASLGLPILSDDGTIFVGPMTTERDAAHFKLTHLLANGSIDAGFNPRFSTYGTVDALARFSNGKWLVAGQFDYINNTALAHPNGTKMVRLNTDGTVDPSFDGTLPATPGGGSGVEKLAIQADGKVVLFGSFPDSNGGRSIIRLHSDGSVDSSFGTFASPLGRAATDALGNIYGYGGSTGSRLVRYSPNGLVDPTFQAPDLGGIHSITPLSDGAVLVDHTPSGFGHYFARLLANGSIDPGFNYPGNIGLVAVAALPDGNVLFGEELTAGNYYHTIKRLRPDGSIDYSYTSHVTNGLGPRDDIRLALAGAVFDLLRGAAPSAAAEITVDFSSSEERMVLNCRTNGELIIRTVGPNGPIQAYQRSALVSPSMDPQPFMISPILPQSLQIPPENGTYYGPYAIAGGLAPFSYQWSKDGVAVAGKTDSILSFDPIRSGDAGVYTLQVSNAYGAIGSAPVTISISSVPVIVTQPQGYAVTLGRSAGLFVSATGTPVLTYQWLKDGSFVPGATNSFYFVSVTKAGDAGSYRVYVGNNYGTVLSDATTLEVGTPPAGFDVAGYLARNPTVAALYASNPFGAWRYYHDHGIYDGQVFDDLFRVEEYLTLYPELFAIFGSDLGAALDHWLSTGRIEGKLGRIPGEFSADGYFTRNPDVAAAVGNDPLLAWGHYWLYGIYEGRAYDDELRVFEYLAINADLTAAFVNDWRQAALHWMRYGRTEGRLGRLPLTFSVAEYLNRSPDVAAVWGTNPTTVFLHFWLYGIDENRTYDDLFRPDEYMTRYPDVATAVSGARRGAFKHWVRYGLPGGRIGRYP